MVYLPFWKIWKLGWLLFPVYGQKIHMFQTINQITFISWHITWYNHSRQLQWHCKPSQTTSPRNPLWQEICWCLQADHVNFVLVASVSEMWPAQWPLSTKMLVLSVIKRPSAVTAVTGQNLMSLLAVDFLYDWEAMIDFLWCQWTGSTFGFRKQGFNCLLPVN